MADELKLDIIVDDHGAPQKLAEVDQGVNKVKGSADQATPSLEGMGTSFLSMGGNVKFAAAAIGIAIPVITFLASQLRAAADEARKFTDAAALMGSSASRIQAVTAAAGDLGIGFDSMVGSLAKLQESIGSGKINEDLRRLIGDLRVFKQADITEQFLRINEAIAGIDDPLKQASTRARIFGSDAQEMGRLAKEGFREAVDGIHGMSEETIKTLDELSKGWDKAYNDIDRRTKTFVADLVQSYRTAGQAHLDLLNTLLLKPGQSPGSASLPNTPTLPTGPTLPSLPVPDQAIDQASAAQLLAMVKAAEDLRKELLGSVDASIELQGVWLTAEGHIQFMSPIMKTIRDLQLEIKNDAEGWGDKLNNKVLASLTAITDRMAAVIASEAVEQNRITKKLSAGGGPDQSEFDKRFLEIDRELKEKLKNAELFPNRAGQQMAENAALETANLKVLELQKSWEGVGKQTQDARKEAEALGASYGRLGNGGYSPGVAGLPPGLVAPTGSQMATGRYFGPVTPNGQPDPSRMGGTTQITNHIDARGALLPDSAAIDELVRRIETRQAERESARGGRMAGR